MARAEQADIKLMRGSGRKEEEEKDKTKQTIDLQKQGCTGLVGYIRPGPLITMESESEL